MLIEALSGNDESGSCGGVNSVQGQPVLHPVAIPGRRWLRGWSNFFNLFMLRYVSFFFFRLNDFFDFLCPWKFRLCGSYNGRSRRCRRFFDWFSFCGHTAVYRAKQVANVPVSPHLNERLMAFLDFLLLRQRLRCGAETAIQVF